MDESSRFKQIERLGRLGLFFIFTTALNVVISVILLIQTEKVQENIARNLDRINQIENHIDALEHKMEGSLH